MKIETQFRRGSEFSLSAFILSVFSAPLTSSRGAGALPTWQSSWRAIEAHDGEAAYQALKSHISKAFETRLRVDSGELRTR